MRILIVDDDLEKIAALTAELARIGVSGDEIDDAAHAVMGLRLAEMTRYDLAIVDILLPAVAGGTAHADAGLDLVRRLQRLTNRPALVAAVTAAENDADLGRRLSSYGAVLLRFDGGTSDWQLGLRALVENLRADRGASAADFGSLACIITALHEPEGQAVLALPWEWQEGASTLAGDTGAYMLGRLPSAPSCEDGLSLVVAASASRMGVPATTALAVRMAIAFRPRLLVMAGIAAGFRGEIRIGDILCPDPVFEWGAGKWVGSGDSLSFKPALYPYNLDAGLRGIVGQRNASESALLEFYNSQDARPPGPPKLVRCVVACGPAVVSSEDVLKFVESQQRKVVGLDMESYGIFQAADEAAAPRPKAVALKAVVDFADERKGDAHQEYGAAASAAAVAHVLRTFANTPAAW